MLRVQLLADGIWAELIRAITGELFTKEKIQQITNHAVGRYFAEFFPEPEREAKAKQRVEEAREHIIEASKIISDMQVDLEAQNTQLDALLADIEEKKQLAEKYAKLAATNQEQFDALKDEMGEALREELVQQSEQGKTLRRVSSGIVWVLTLFLGAALGAYFKDIVVFVQAFFM